MLILKKEKSTIYKLTCNKIDAKEAEKIKAILKKDVNTRIAFDLSRVYDCTIDFLNLLYEIAVTKNVCVFNLSSDIFALFISLNMDKFVEIFTLQSDFEENLHRLINRKFTLLVN